MSYTPPSEQIDVEQAKTSLKELATQVSNRVFDNLGGWSFEHLEQCKRILRLLTDLVTELENL